MLTTLFELLTSEVGYFGIGLKKKKPDIGGIIMAFSQGHLLQVSGEALSNKATL